MKENRLLSKLASFAFYRRQKIIQDPHVGLCTLRFFKFFFLDKKQNIWFRKKSNRGFLLIEVILAIGIVGGAVLCLLALFTPIFTKARDLRFVEALDDIEGKLNTYIQMRSFNEIYKAAQQEETFYFYEDEKGSQEVSKHLSEIKSSGSIIKATLVPSMMTSILSSGPEDYLESYFALCVEINEIGGRQSRKCVIIKNR